MTMKIELPSELEQALKVQANAHGISVSSYVREMVEHELASAQQRTASFKTGRGALAGLGAPPSAEEIERNRIEMFGGFGESF
jgi:plasmid stability protein